MNISSGGVSSSSSSDPYSEYDKFPVQKQSQKRALKQLDRLNYGIQIFAVIAIISLVATIVLLGLTLARYVHPLLALYTFSGCIAPFIVIKAIDCCQQSIAKKNDFDLQDGYYRYRQPPPEPKNKTKSEK